MPSPITVEYDFEPSQIVYIISPCNGQLYIERGEVVRVRIDVLVSGTTIRYDIRLDGTTGTRSFTSDDVFVDKATALAEYGTRV